MLLAISADLSAPPSESVIFRDVCLFAKVFRHHDILAYSEKDLIDQYVVWFRRHGLFDFVDDIVTEKEIKNAKIQITSGKLTTFNWHETLSYL